MTPPTPYGLPSCPKKYRKLAEWVQEDINGLINRSRFKPGDKLGQLTTTVHATAIERFLRPVCYQDVPEELRPEALRFDNPLGLVRIVDGELQRPD